MIFQQEPRKTIPLLDQHFQLRSNLILGGMSLNSGTGSWFFKRAFLLLGSSSGASYLGLILDPNSMIPRQIPFYSGIRSSLVWNSLYLSAELLLWPVHTPIILSLSSIGCGVLIFSLIFTAQLSQPKTTKFISSLYPIFPSLLSNLSEKIPSTQTAPCV